ncbi:MAG: GFA family protein [Terricaulis sp.]
MSVDGGCRCGAVRYRLALDQLPRTYACHCRDCQTSSGSAFSQQAAVPEAALTIAGPLVIYEHVTEDRVSRQRFCGVCHCRLYNTNTARPGVAVVRAGTLDDSDKLDVAAHIWASRKQAWVTIPGGAPQWPEGPPVAEFFAVMTGSKA